MRIRTQLRVGLGGACVALCLLGSLSLVGGLRLKGLAKDVNSPDPVIRDTRLARLDRFVWVHVGLSGATMVIFLAGAAYLLFRHAMPTAQALAESSESILTERGWDIVDKLNAKGGGAQDELHAFVRGMVEFGDEMRSRLGTVSTLSVDASMQSQGLAASAEEVHLASEHMSSLTQQTTANLRGQSDILGGLVKDLGQLEGAGKKLELLNQASNEECGRAAEVVDKGVSVIRQADSQLVNVMAAMRPMDALIDTLEQRSREIDHVGQLIANISSQTDVLALNATIEAVKAGGEAGRGFTVVAQRIRRLATESTEAADRIRAQVGDIRDTVAQVVSVLSDLSRQLEEGRSASEDGTDQLSLLKRSTERIAEMVNETTQLSEATRDMGTRMGEIFRKVSKLVEEGLAASENAQGVVDQQTVAAVETSQIAGDLSRLVSKIDADSEACAELFTASEEEAVIEVDDPEDEVGDEGLTGFDDEENV